MLNTKVKRAKKLHSPSLLQKKRNKYDGVTFFYYKTKNIYTSFIISKKVSKKSVERNKLKRMLQHTIIDNKEKIIPFTGLFFCYKYITPQDILVILQSEGLYTQ